MRMKSRLNPTLLLFNCHGLTPLTEFAVFEDLPSDPPFKLRLFRSDNLIMPVCLGGPLSVTLELLQSVWSLSPHVPKKMKQKCYRTSNIQALPTHIIFFMRDSSSQCSWNSCVSARASRKRFQLVQDYPRFGLPSLRTLDRPGTLQGWFWSVKMQSIGHGETT